MSERTHPRARRALTEPVAARPRHRRRQLWVVAAALALGLAGGATWSAWSAGFALPGTKITAGDLRVTVGGMMWQQVTPGVADPASGRLVTTPTDFVAMPGDVIELRVPVTTLLRGDNLGATLSVAYSSPDAGSAITATFHVQNASGAQVAPAGGEAPANSAVTVTGLTGTDRGVSANWTVVVTVHVLGDPAWVTPETPDPGLTWNPGRVLADLQQVRPTIGGTP